MPKASVYILRCSDGTFYTGYSRDLEARLTLHQSGRASRYTRSRLPVEMVFSREYRSASAAFAAERQIKRMHRKAKEHLVSGNPEVLRRIA